MAFESKAAIRAAILGNLAVAVVKFAAAAITGSSAMFSEGIHSIVDTGDGLLLHYGLRRSRRPPDSEHPFGHGKELYFWSLVVAMMIFAVGGGVTIYEGILHLQQPEPIERAGWTYAALGAAAVFEGISAAVAYRQFRKSAGEHSLWKAVLRSKDPSVFTVLFEDSAALAGIAFAFGGIVASRMFGVPALDGVASIAIGLLLGVVALLLGRECMSLLVGEGVDAATVRRLRAIAEQTGMRCTADPLTMYFGPDSMMVTLSVAYPPSASVQKLTESVDATESRMRHEFPKIRRVFIKTESEREEERLPVCTQHVK